MANRLQFGSFLNPLFARSPPSGPGREVMPMRMADDCSPEGSVVERLGAARFPGGPLRRAVL